MSIEELLEFIKQELNGCQGYTFIDKALQDLGNAMKKREFFSPNKFKQWFIDKSVIYKNNPLGFLIKCGIEDIENGEFDKEEATGFVIVPLTSDLKKREIAYTPKDILLLDTYIAYIYNHELMTKKEIFEWLHNAVDYIEKHSKNASEFKNLFRKTRTMKKLNLPYEELERKVKRNNSRWDEILKQLDGDDDLPFDKNGTAIPKESETNNGKQEINNPST